MPNKQKISIKNAVSAPLNHSCRKLTPEGYLHANATLIKAGVLKYTLDELTKNSNDRNKTAAVLLSPDLLFDSKTTESMRYKAITVDHPKKDVNSGNFNQHAVGVIGANIDKAGNALNADIAITQKNTVECIQQGVLGDVSLGFDTYFEPESGTFNGESYGYVFKPPLVVNHCAVVPPKAARSVGSKIHNTKNIKLEEQNMPKKKVETQEQSQETEQTLPQEQQQQGDPVVNLESNPTADDFENLYPDESVESNTISDDTTEDKPAPKAMTEADVDALIKEQAKVSKIFSYLTGLKGSESMGVEQMYRTIFKGRKDADKLTLEYMRGAADERVQAKIKVDKHKAKVVNRTVSAADYARYQSVPQRYSALDLINQNNK